MSDIPVIQGKIAEIIDLTAVARDRRLVNGESYNELDRIIGQLARLSNDLMRLDMKEEQCSFSRSYPTSF